LSATAALPSRLAPSWSPLAHNRKLRLDGAVFIGPDHPAVADHIGSDDCSKAAFHVVSPIRASLTTIRL